MHADWLLPDWPAPASVRAVCTTRAGGGSLPPYDGFNLGDHVGDDPACVAAHREALRQQLGTRPVFLQQVHGTQVLELNAASADGAQADACIATAPGVACTIMVADCLPVLFTDEEGSVVAAAHAGWRGLAGAGGRGVLEQVYERIMAGVQAGRPPRAMKNGADGRGSAPRLLAWLGPCIGPQAFEVGPEVKAAFEAHDPAAAGLFRAHGAGKWLADLPGLARQRLAALGVTQVYGNDGSAAWCTVGNPSRFFSHRRDRVSGRFAACIWRV